MFVVVNYKHDAGLASNCIMFVPNFVKVSELVKKLKGAQHTHTENVDFVNLLFP